MKRKETKGVKVIAVEYNNKSRKGVYLRIRFEGEKRAHIIKYDKEKKIEDHIKEIKGEEKKQTRRNIETIVKAPKIEAVLKKGMHTAEIKNALTSTPAQHQKQKEKMIKKMLWDKQLIRIMTQPENLKKLANRTEHIVEITGRQGELLIKYNVMGKTTDEVINQVREIIVPNEEFNITKPSQCTTVQSLNFRNMKFQMVRNGIIANANVKIAVRKG